MVRVTKEPHVRRDELLDVAFDLCAADGFESASVERITTAAGVAKGTFYHYFVSKDDLLAQMITRFGDRLFEHLESSMRDVGGDALARLRTLMLLSSEWKLARFDTAMATMPMLFRDENYTFRHKLFDEWFDRIRPLLLPIVEQGALEGTFKVEDPLFTTNVVLTLWLDFAGRLWGDVMNAADETAFVETMSRGAEMIWTAQERLLGVPAGSLAIPIDRSVLVASLSTLEASGALPNLGKGQAHS